MRVGLLRYSPCPLTQSLSEIDACKYDVNKICIANVCVLCYYLCEVIKMARSSVLNLRIEPEVKADAEELFSCFGLTVTDAVNVFLRQAIMHGGFPFEIIRHKPNEVTRAAINEAEKLLHDNDAKTFTSMDELKADLMRDEDDDV